MTSRQLARKRKLIASGKCGSCGRNPLARGSRSSCSECLRVNRRVARIKAGCAPWKKGKRGRPPAEAKR